MKKAIALWFLLCVCSLGLCFAQPAEDSGTKIILLISEQNIEGPQQAWWASEVDLSSFEATVAAKLIGEGFVVLEPSYLEQVVRKDTAFRRVDMDQASSVKLGSHAKAAYVVQGKAVASAGGNVPSSHMRSCFANATAKLIRVKDGKVMAYLSASGSSAHPDVITGGKEALVSAGEDLAVKLIAALKNK